MVQGANGLKGAPSRTAPSGVSDVAEGTLRGLPASMFIHSFVRHPPEERRREEPPYSPVYSPAPRHSHRGRQFSEVVVDPIPTCSEHCLSQAGRGGLPRDLSPPT
jgi:hypothetical protein